MTIRREQNPESVPVSFSKKGGVPQGAILRASVRACTFLADPARRISSLSFGACFVKKLYSAPIHPGFGSALFTRGVPLLDDVALIPLYGREEEGFLDGLSVRLR